MENTNWIDVKERLPELQDNSIIAHFDTGSIETVHIQDWFAPIRAGFDSKGNQKFSKWYLTAIPTITHWMPLPDPPTPR